jgi:CRP-like cAMP-binding protein
VTTNHLRDLHADRRQRSTHERCQAAGGDRRQFNSASGVAALRARLHDQATQTALANGRSKIEERLARWLLMANDRIDGNELALTHEFLATMLGMRLGVTVALQQLESTGLISHKRGLITILDREALEVAANGTYFPISER